MSVILHVAGGEHLLSLDDVHTVAELFAKAVDKVGGAAPSAFSAALLGCDGEEVALSSGDDTPLGEVGIVGVDEVIRMSVVAEAQARAWLQRAGVSSSGTLAYFESLLPEGAADAEEGVVCVINSGYASPEQLNKSLTDRVITAGRRQNLPWVQHLLKLADVGAEHVEGFGSVGAGHPLKLFAKYGFVEGVRALLLHSVRRGVDVPKSKATAEAFCEAAAHGHEDCLAAFLDFGTNVGVRATSRDTALHAAARELRLNTARYLLFRGADASLLNECDGNPLHTLAKRRAATTDAGAVQAMVQLLAQHVSIDAVQHHKWTPMHMAAFYGNVPVGRALAGSGAAVDKFHLGGRGMTPLHIAAERGNSAFVEFLLGRGASASSTGSFGKTPLHLATEAQDASAVEALLEAAPEALSVRDENGQTPLAIGYSLTSQNEVLACLLSAHEAQLNRTR